MKQAGIIQEIPTPPYSKSVMIYRAKEECL